jgi:hypothetical protein
LSVSQAMPSCSLMSAMMSLLSAISCLLDSTETCECD